MYIPPDFLGNKRLSGNLDDCSIELTDYTTESVFEEWHSHKNSSISFLINGSHIEDLGGKMYKRTPGIIKYVCAGELHRCYGYAQGTRKINLNITDVFLKKLSITDHQVEQLTASPQSKFTLLKLLHELDDQGSHSDASAQLLLFELFAPQKRISERNIKHRPDWTKRLQEQLHDDWNAKLNLDELAANARIHPVSLSRYFPRYFSITLGTYIKHIKIDKALTLIKTGNLPLTAIAYQCGFSDQAHFTRTFKQVTGYLPKDFRTL